MTKAGFIGLGSMGAPIARRLARCGFSVTGCDISPEMLADFDEPGTTREADPIATARASEMLGICVRTDEQLEQLADDGQLFAALGSGGTVILHSTVSPELAQRMAAKAAEYGVGFVDVGVSGGGPAAIEGQLSLFVGAEPADLEKARPWLEAIGKQISHLGPVGRGQQGKLLNNLISIANYGTSAAIVDIAMDMGFERDQFVEALNAGSAQSFAMKVGPRFVQPRSGTGATGSLAGLHDLLKKDVDHCRDLPVHERSALTGLLSACDLMLARLRRAQAEADGKAGRDPHATIDAYFAAVRARDLDAFVALFAPDADYTMPNGARMEGHASIREAQTKVFTHGAPVPSPGARYIGTDGVAVEVQAKLPDGTVRNTVNLYRFNAEGLIRSLAVTMRTG